METQKKLQYSTIKLRLYPNEVQQELFTKTFGCCRWIWNHMLADQQRFYNETDAHFIPIPAKYKTEAPFLKEVDNQALIQEHNQLSQAFRNFFKNPEHFRCPRFKCKKDDRDSFTACNHVFTSGPTIYLTEDGIRMTKAGVVKAKFSRRPQSGWKLKRVTVEKTRGGHYFCYVLFAHTQKVPEPVVPHPEKTLGLKYSLSHFYVTDQGIVADPPRWMALSAERRKIIQQRLDRMTPGSTRYQKEVRKYQLLHEHIANQRRDYLHKASSLIAKEYDAVCIRLDDLTELSQKVKQGNVMDSGFGLFRKYLAYKLERQGKCLLEIDRFEPTTRTCHCCGGLLPESPSPKRRFWTCPECGAVLDREQNAAINIKASGLMEYQKRLAV